MRVLDRKLLIRLIFGSIWSSCVRIYGFRWDFKFTGLLSKRVCDRSFLFWLITGSGGSPIVWIYGYRLILRITGSQSMRFGDLCFGLMNVFRFMRFWSQRVTEVFIVFRLEIEEMLLSLVLGSELKAFEPTVMFSSGVLFTSVLFSTVVSRASIPEVEKEESGEIQERFLSISDLKVAVVFEVLEVSLSKVGEEFLDVVTTKESSLLPDFVGTQSYSLELYIGSAVVNHNGVWLVLYLLPMDYMGVSLSQAVNVVVVESRMLVLRFSCIILVVFLGILQAVYLKSEEAILGTAKESFRLIYFVESQRNGIAVFEMSGEQFFNFSVLIGGTGCKKGTVRLQGITSKKRNAHILTTPRRRPVQKGVEHVTEGRNPRNQDMAKGIVGGGKPPKHKVDK